MQVANLNQLVQNALQELDYLSTDFVCSGVWCATTAAAYRRFLIDEKVDPHFAGVQPAEASHLPKTLFDYIFREVTEIAEQVGESVTAAVEDVIDLIAPGETVIVNIGELSLGKQAAKEEKPAAQVIENEQGEEKPNDAE